MGKITTNNFIKSCIERHGDRYDYSLVEYKNMRSKVSIICNDHGVFFQNPKNHRDGQGCPKCYGNRNLTKEEFINLCKNKNYYDYSLIDDKIIKIKSLIKVIDKSTGLIYQQFATHHLDGLKPTKIESKSLITKKIILIYKRK